MICNLCGTDIPKFIGKKDKDGKDTLVCPVCESYPRHRALVAGFSSLWGTDIRILHIGPSGSLARYFFKEFENRPNVSYLPLDLRPQVNGVVQYDVQVSNLKVVEVDLAVIFYVLDEVVDEHQAMLNVAESVKVGGKLLFDVPLKEGLTDRGYDNPADNANGKVKDKKKKDVKVLKEDERAVRFNTKHAFRVYGEDDIIDFINGYGFNAVFKEVAKDNSIGLDVKYRLIEATKL